MAERYDVVVVGAGAMGLAMATRAADDGAHVLVLDRERRPYLDQVETTSVRAYGNILACGHPAGAPTQLALRARELWLRLLERLGVWHRACGLVFLVRTPEEEAVATEFYETFRQDLELRIRSAGDLASEVPGAGASALLFGMHSPLDVLVDPRELMPVWADVLARMPNVEVRRGCAALQVEDGGLRTSGGLVEGSRIYVCTGRDVVELFEDCGLTEVKLQLVRCRASGTQSWGPVVCGGLTMAHMKGFGACPSRPALVERLMADHPTCWRTGIHVMAASTPDQGILIGDSHEYPPLQCMTEKQEIDDAMVAYAESLLDVGELDVVDRWSARYYRAPDRPWQVADLHPRVTSAIALGGTGLTLSLALAEVLHSSGSIGLECMES